MNPKPIPSSSPAPVPALAPGAPVTIFTAEPGAPATEPALYPRARAHAARLEDKELAFLRDLTRRYEQFFGAMGVPTAITDTMKRAARHDVIS